MEEVAKLNKRISKMRPKIYRFGDSIIEESFADGGWGSSLADHFSCTLDVVLRGYSGYTTRWALKVAERVFPAVKDGSESGDDAPIAVTVSLGQMTLVFPIDALLSNTCLSMNTSKNSTLLSRFSRIGILLITPPIDEEARLRHPYIPNPMGLPERTNKAAGAYAKTC